MMRNPLALGASLALLSLVHCGEAAGPGDVAGLDATREAASQPDGTATPDDVPTRSPDASDFDSSLPAEDAEAPMDAVGPRDATAASDARGNDASAPDAAVDSAADSGAGVRLAVNASWHIDLEAPVNTSVDADVFDIDLFDNSESVIRAIHARGHRVICYFSAGSYENWRPDASMFPMAALGRDLDGWPGERWLDVRNTALRTVMQRRLDLARTKGCDGVDPDNVDGYTQMSGFTISAANQLDYNRFLAREAHARGLLIGLKNDLDQVTSLVGDFDFAINEACFRYNECARETPFVRASKPVLQIEYGTISTLQRTVCPEAMRLGFFSILPGADRLAGDYTRCSDGRAIR
ncbi:MAG: endo alpha-1,4 polygalactosaminidase [Deltaproteobacteria bacterium]|nr:endo alpha-1,4 polygalactosaminidase [Deltaproteobacteria bacterium]